MDKKESMPIKILNEAKPFVVTIETKSGKIYRGKLIHVEKNMNCQLENATSIDFNGKTKKFDRIFLRGGNLRIIILPDLIKESPFLNKI